MTEPAPLLEIPATPVPTGGAAEWFAGAQGARLRAALFPARGPARGTVVLSGGRTEAIEKYFEVIEDLTLRSFVVLAHDWRGQGLSHRDLSDDRLKGHAAGFEPFLADFDALLAHFEDRLPKPRIALGHSMGGCLTLLALAKGQAPSFAGAVLSAPMLGLRVGRYPQAARLLAGWNCLTGRGSAYCMGDPGKPFDDNFDDNALTRDRVRFARSRGQVATHQDLALGAPTWGWLDFALRAADVFARPGNLAGVNIPVTICQAEEEKLVDNAAQDRVARSLPQGRLVVVRGALHEILMETDDKRAVFFSEFDALAAKVASPASPSA